MLNGRRLAQGDERLSMLIVVAQSEEWPVFFGEWLKAFEVKYEALNSREEVSDEQLGAVKQLLALLEQTFQEFPSTVYMLRGEVKAIYAALLNCNNLNIMNELFSLIELY